MMAAGLDPHRRGGAPHLRRGKARRAVAHATRGRACSRTSSACWRGSDGRALRRRRNRPDQVRREAHRRVDAGLVREAALRALEDAELDLERHRRGGDRQGARHVRGRDDARALPGRRAGLRRQADAARAHGRQRGRLDGDRGREPGAGRHPRTRAHGRLREAVREQRHVGAVDQDPVPRSGRGGRRRLLRAADPRLHAALRRARGHGHPRGAEGPPERAQEPLRPPPDPGHRLRQDGQLADALGSDPLPRDLPVLGRRLRDGAVADETQRRAGAAAARLGPRHRHAQRADPVLGPRPGESPGGPRLRRGALQEGRHHEPARGDRLRRDLRALQLVRAHVDGEPGLRRGRRGLEDDLRGRDRARRRPARQHVRRRAVLEPDRRLGHAPLRRGGDAGARPGRRAPGGRRPQARWATPTAAAPSTSRCGSSRRSRCSGDSAGSGSRAPAAPARRPQPQATGLRLGDELVTDAARREDLHPALVDAAHPRLEEQLLAQRCGCLVPHGQGLDAAGDASGDVARVEHLVEEGRQDTAVEPRPATPWNPSRKHGRAP